jgi:exopolysaccharide biosynthesis WecB/TagA/CpsF family protein
MTLLNNSIALSGQGMNAMSDVLEIDDYDLRDVTDLAARFGTDRFGSLVTPNVDHIIRHYYEPRFRQTYTHASYVLLDSRFLARIMSVLKRRPIRTCLGSDLTAEVFDKVLQPTDTAVLIGGSAEQADKLRAMYGLKALHHYNPPMNFIRDPQAVETTLQLIESHSPFRFCFLAVGSPQQEILAQMLKERGKARGLALCIGASINFMTGAEKRAPEWLQKLGMEWFYRLIQNPRRLAKRYLVRGPIIFLLLWRVELRLRRGATLYPGPTVPVHTTG